MPDRRTNRLLSLLPDDEYERLRPHLSHVVFDYRKSLYEASRPIDHVYFPIDGVASLVITIANGASAEVGTIGSEGLVGLPICLGDRNAPSSVYVQVPGTALTMDARLFRSELDRSRALNLIMLRYAHAFFNQVAQSAACARLHRLEQRCCRWLLMTRDRMPAGDFLLTQEFVGEQKVAGWHPVAGHQQPAATALFHLVQVGAGCRLRDLVEEGMGIAEHDQVQCRAPVEFAAEEAGVHGESRPGNLHINR